MVSDTSLQTLNHLLITLIVNYGVDCKFAIKQNKNTSIVACLFVAAGTCLPRRCLVMNVYSDFTIPTFGRHIVYHNILSPGQDLNPSSVEYEGVMPALHRCLMKRLQFFLLSPSKGRRRAAP
jgi:hypothetical protein